MDMVEDAVSRELGRAQVAVHAEPATAGERANDRIAAAALRVPGVVETHNITVLQEAGGLGGDAARAAPRAHAAWARRGGSSSELKREIRREIGVARVYAHVEPSVPDAQPARRLGGDEPAT